MTRRMASANCSEDSSPREGEQSAATAGATPRLDMYWEKTVQLPGESLIRAVSDGPSGVSGCSLSDILEWEVPEETLEKFSSRRSEIDRLLRQRDHHARKRLSPFLADALRMCRPRND